MAATPYLLQLPSPDSMPYRGLLNGVSAMAISAESTADARAVAKAKYGNDVDVMWAQASINPIAAATDMNGWALRVRVIDTSGNTVVDKTVSADGTNLSFVAAAGTLTNDGTNVTDGDTVTIGSKVYTLQGTLTNVDGHVHIGASNTATMTNLFHAINGAGGTSGTDYAAATVANADVTATNPSGTTVVVTAKTAGSAGNLIASTETSTHLSWGAATLAGGIGATDKMSSLALKMVAALNADALIAGAAWNDGTQTLKVAETTDSLGDHRLAVYAIPAGADPDQLIGVPGLVGALTHNGLAGAALSVVLAADNYAIPQVIAVLGAGV